MSVPPGHPVRAHAGWQACAWCKQMSGAPEADGSSALVAPVVHAESHCSGCGQPLDDSFFDAAGGRDCTSDSYGGKHIDKSLEPYFQPTRVVREPHRAHALQLGDVLHEHGNAVILEDPRPSDPGHPGRRVTVQTDQGRVVLPLNAMVTISRVSGGVPSSS
ncbi:MAG: hypothetical protein ACSLE6_12215 [Mycobacterium sp.]